MARWGLTVVMCVAAVLLFGGVSAASGNEPPMADAGLDQTVDNGTTVYLDAGGSVDPDGTIASVQWTITGPDGNAVTSTCATCARTQFTPNETGNYTANVSVADDAGATRNDTLYVTVEERNGPTVTLMGPGRTTRNEPTEFTVSTAAGDAELRQLYWIENGSSERQLDLSGDESNVTLNRSFSEAKSYELAATVQDTKGYSQTSSLNVRVVSPGGGGAGGFEHCPDGGSPYFADGDFIGCNDGGADMIYGDHVLEANGESGLDLYNQDADEITQMASEQQVEEIQKAPNVPLTRDVVEENYGENLENDQKGDSGENIPQRYTGARSSTGSSSGTDSDSPYDGEGPRTAPYPALNIAGFSS